MLYCFLYVEDIIERARGQELKKKKKKAQNSFIYDHKCSENKKFGYTTIQGIT